MKRLLTICVVAVLVLSMSGLAQAATLTVGPSIIDDYSTIQEAINAAAPYDTISVAGGTYTEYLIINKDGLTIQGAGIDKSIIDLAGLTPYWHYPGSSSFASRAGVLISGYGNLDEIVEGVTFKGFTVKNAGLNPPMTASGTHTGANDAAVLTDSSASFPVPNGLVGQWVHNYGDRDTDYKPARSYGLITANTSTTVAVTSLSGGIDNDWDAGDQYLITPYQEFHNSFWIHYRNYDGLRGIGIGNGKDILIQNCKITDSGYGGITTGYARLVGTHRYSENLTVDNCIITDHPTIGINIGNNVGPFTITNNTCERIKRLAYHDDTREYSGAGIQVSGTKNYGMASGLISGNTCKNNGYEGIIVDKYTDGVTVVNNTVTGHNLDEDGAGIFMYHYGHPEWCTNHIVMDNKVTGNHRGIIAYYASNCLIEGNNIETDSANWYAGPGIKLDHSNNIEVKKNHLHGVEGHSILVVYSETNTIHKNILNNNGRTGIYLYNSHENSVIDNVGNHNEYGIQVRFSNSNIIEGNRALASYEYDLYEEESTGNTWENNKYKTKNW